ncbi:toxin VasX [Vibrio sp. Of7-15]|uniref:toxin VasX n=1 Tax=Vibrio sp. Of7-15 TaxID=2724879 RepID=UPI0031BA8D38
MFKSDSTCYTLRQLRDGWLYALHQSPKTQEWQLEEYQVTQSELARIPGLTAEERMAASPEPLKTHLLLSDSQSYFLGYSVKRWSQRICDHYLEKEAEREQWLRKVELSQSNEHRIGIEQIEQYVADVAPENSDDFKFTCAPFSGDSSEPNDFICITSDKNEASYRYQAPSAQQQQLVALDDPLGDLSDLYLALLMPILITTLDDETQHKVVMAETIRSIARAAIPADKIPDIEPEQWTEFESALDTCLEFHYFKTQYEKFKSAGPSSESARMSIQLESQACRDAYPEAKQTLTKMGFTDIQPYLESYIDRRKAHQQVNWSQLDDFYKTHLMEQAKANSAIQPAFQALLTAIPLIGTDPMNIGIDLLQGDHMAYLLDLFGEIVPALNTVAQDEQQQAELANAIVQDSPDNLLALASSFFSADLYTKTDELAAQTDVIALQRESVPISGVVAGLNGVMGYGMGAESGLLKHTLDIVTPADQLITSTQTALKGGVLSSWQKMSFILLGIQAKKGGYRAGLNIAIMTWSVEQVTKGKLGLNPAFKGTDTPFRQRFVDTVKESEALKKRLRKSTKGSKNYIKSNNRLERLIKRLAGMVEDTPAMFDSVNSKAIAKPARLFSNMNAKFNAVGRVDFVVAFANAINVIVQQQTLSDTLASAPEIDASGQLHVLGFSSAWLVHATGDIFRGMAFDQMKQVDGLLDKSLKSLVRSSSGSIKANTAQLAKAYVNRSMLVGMAGVVAAGWEAFRTYEDAKAANSEAERYLLYVKTGILVGQAFIWGTIGVNAIRARLTNQVIGIIFRGWMAAGLFWLGFAYLMVSLILNYLKKSPLETWLLNSTWGKEPKDWTPEEEYQALLQLLNQPQIQSKAVKSRYIEGKMAEPYKPLPLEYQQRITLTFPQQSAGKLVGLAINVHQQRDVKPLYGYGSQQQTETTTMQLNDTHLAQGTWAVDESHQPSFTFDVPIWLQSTDSIDFLVSVTGTNPFANEQTVAQTYQSRIKPGLSPVNVLMKDLEKLNLTNNNIITLKIE